MGRSQGCEEEAKRLRSLHLRECKNYKLRQKCLLKRGTVGQEIKSSRNKGERPGGSVNICQKRGKRWSYLMTWLPDMGVSKEEGKP